MTGSELEKIVQFQATPGQRLPCRLLLDTSGSMSGDRIREVNDGIKLVHATLSDPDFDSVARDTVELAIMTFDSQITLIQDFALAKDIADLPTLTAQNQTFLGQALIEALDCTEQRKQFYRQVGSPHFRPLIFLLSDGMPEGEPPGGSGPTRHGGASH
ncbi:MAG: VWA domain-containing protein [Chloroflexi bacterium]|nr:VWA domain-containing protein [Chloroflexota bacterium]MBV9602459.1 VWA domain-containing protein [Chloroflexota bacterium]